MQGNLKGRAMMKLRLIKDKKRKQRWFTNQGLKAIITCISGSYTGLHIFEWCFQRKNFPARGR